MGISLSYALTPPPPPIPFRVVSAPPIRRIPTKIVNTIGINQAMNVSRVKSRLGTTVEVRSRCTIRAAPVETS